MTAAAGESRLGTPRLSWQRWAHDSREVLISLTATGLAAHDAIVDGAQERNRRVLEHLSEAELHALLRQVDQLTAIAAEMLESEKNLR